MIVVDGDSQFGVLVRTLARIYKIVNSNSAFGRKPID